jgi:hypothetical protein
MKFLKKYSPLRDFFLRNKFPGGEKADKNVQISSFLGFCREKIDF